MPGGGVKAGLSRACICLTCPQHLANPSSYGTKAGSRTCTPCTSPAGPYMTLAPANPGKICTRIEGNGQVCVDCVGWHAAFGRAAAGGAHQPGTGIAAGRHDIPPQLLPTQTQQPPLTSTPSSSALRPSHRTVSLRVSARTANTARRDQCAAGAVALGLHAVRLGELRSQAPPQHRPT